MIIPMLFVTIFLLPPVSSLFPYTTLFRSVGAYTAAYLSNHFALPFWLTIPAGGFAAAAVGAVFGVPSLRVKGLYLALTTIAASFILQSVFFNWTPVTAGARGLTIAPASIVA